MAIDRVALPVVDIDLLHAAKHQLQLALVEIVEPLQRNDFIESVQESFRLLFNAAIHPPVRHQPIDSQPPKSIPQFTINCYDSRKVINKEKEPRPQIFFFILLVDAYVIAARLQFVMRQLAQHFEIGREIQFQTTLFQVVVFHPHERVVKLGVDRFDVFRSQFLVQHALVER